MRAGTHHTAEAQERMRESSAKRWGTAEARFHAGYAVVGPCWEWQKAKDQDGYGFIRYDGRLMHASRASYLLFIGPIPDGMEVCHTCDNPPCVRPDHLFVGTRQDNALDAVGKGRIPTGDRHWRRQQKGND